VGVAVAVERVRYRCSVSVVMLAAIDVARTSAADAANVAVAVALTLFNAASM